MAHMSFHEALAAEQRKFAADPQGYMRYTMPDFEKHFAEIEKLVRERNEEWRKKLDIQSQVIEETRKEMSDLRTGGWSGAGASWENKSGPGDVVIKATDALQALRTQGTIRIPLEDGFFPHTDKKAITALGLGLGTAGVMPSQRRDGVIPAPERRLTIRDLLPSRRATAGQVTFLRESSFDNQAGIQPFEGSPKSESSLALEAVTEQVRTLAHWLPASRQVLDDLPELADFINRKLLFGLALVEEQQILSGDGTGQNLNGLIAQATAFDEGLLQASDNRADALRRALGQLQEAEEEAAFFVVHSRDWTDIELTKNSEGIYLIQTPAGAAAAPVLWGRPVVVTNAISQGNFLAGDRMMAEVWDRQGASVMISTEHSDYFTRNLVAIRAEERIALAVYRGSAFVYGSFETLSPPS